MPKSKSRKNHKEKVSKRNNKIKEQKKKIEKMRRNFIDEIIKMENEKGLFNKTPNVDGPVVDGPVVDGPVVDGPVVDGPVI
jgi:hypothetical protein